MFQLFHVLSMCNNVNIRILGLCLDGGGNNSRLLSLLRHEAKLGNSNWFDDESLISFKDPTLASNNESENRISVMNCSTHNQKALRNAFLNSTTKLRSARKFKSIDNIKFTWEECVQECFFRDKMNDLPQTKLDKNSVYPNAWNKMSVGHSLCPFSEKTINEQFTHLGSLLGVSNDMYFKGTFTENTDLSAMYKKRLATLRNTINLKGENLDDGSIKVKFAGLEYSCHIAVIFNEHFMNKEKSLTLENIDACEAEIKDSLKYFSDWRKACILNKSKDKEWEKACISAVTFNNLRIQAVGFFSFARRILKLDTIIWNVPFLYSNQSSLESHFSQMRARGSDSPQKYISGIAAIETAKMAKSLSLHKNKWYEGTVDDGEVGLACTPFERAMQITTEKRNQIVQTWILEGMTASKTDVLNKPIPVVDTNAFKIFLQLSHANVRYKEYFIANKKVFENIINLVSRIQLPSDYRTYLLKQTPLEEIAIASAGSGSSSSVWFENLLRMNDTENLLRFNEVCQKIVAKVLVLFINSCVVGDRSKDSNFWYTIYNTIDNGDMFGATGPFSLLPESVSSNQNGKYILLEKITILLENWIACHMREQIDKERDPQVSSNQPQSNNIPRKVNGFVGFAISRLIKIYEKKEKIGCVDDDETKISENESVIAFLKSMRILHREALVNEDYMRNCYAETDKMLNHGGLTLISPPFFQFATQLIHLCDVEISYETISERGNKSYNLASKNILGNKELKQTFKTFCIGMGAGSHLKKHVDNISSKK